jgi:hypothetical protein
VCGRAAAAAWLGRAAAWRSRARRQCTFQTKSAFGRNRALSGRARRAKLWVWTLSTCGATIAAILFLNQLTSYKMGGRLVV